MHMSQEVKENWLPKVRARYEKRGREGKTQMLDELPQSPPLGLPGQASKPG
jgi:hypothetical protein